MSEPTDMIAIEADAALWERCHMLAPLTVVGTREADGRYNLAPKHMAMPLSWEPYFGFVCTPSHATYGNVQREGAFTVSFPRPDQVVLTSLAAAPRCEDSQKHALSGLPTIPARLVDGVLLKDAYLHFECELDRIVDGFGRNGLIAGRIVAASVAADCLREADIDDQDLLRRAPLLAYLHPGRFARISETHAFPYHKGFSR
jgi:flavin reductase (DIM6/NTAB) family NADH-FMN oxidoreductase RutF